MIEFYKAHQLAHMLFLGGASFVTALFVLLTRFTSVRRKVALFVCEICGFILIISDRYAYIFRGDASSLGYYMVRISNFLTFFMTLVIVAFFNLYVTDVITYVKQHESGSGLDVDKKDKDRQDAHLWLMVSLLVTIIGVLLLIVSQFTGLYYTFDAANTYQRGSGFIICYIIPFVAIGIQTGVIIRHFDLLSPGIRVSLLLFTIVPLFAAVIQFFVYGISLTNNMTVIVVILLYIFALIDLNSNVRKASETELDRAKSEQESMKRLFDQTASALVNAVDAKDPDTHGHSARVAEYSKKIAETMNLSEEDCESAYYAGLLHDVGKIGIPVSIINKKDKLTEEEYEIIKQHPVLGDQILSSITEYPYLSIGTRHHHERYDGKGYPDRLKGDDIPLIARIIAVADAYDEMTSKKSYRDPMPQSKVREELLKNSGTKFDPQIAKIMQHLIDLDSEFEMKEKMEATDLSGKGWLYCGAYRSEVSEGIVLTPNITTIKLKYKPQRERESDYSTPAMVIFDSLDGREHTDEKHINELNYFEYGELFFDGHDICTEARKFRTVVTEKEGAGEPGHDEAIDYVIEAIKIKDHARIKIDSKYRTVECTIAFPDAARYAYIGLTGEHCRIDDVDISKSEELYEEGYIERIAEAISYINRPEGDVPNVQIDGYRYASTKGIPIEDDMVISFHTMSLPTARLVWHCPYIDVFYSDDGTVDGDNFKEYALIRFDGENWEAHEYAKNKMLISQNEDFEGWDVWKENNKKGYDCSVSFKRRGKKITVLTENFGISIKNVVTVNEEESDDVYVALTGDQIALTEIRIKKETE